MLRIATLGALLALSGCTVADRCAGGTVLVAVTLSGGAADADQLVVDVALDGDPPHESTLAHQPGSAAGNVVVKFPSGYPRGHTVAIAVSARAAGVELGSESVAVQLGDGCEAIALEVAPALAGDGGGDLGDGGGDLAAVDMTPAPDLAHCVPVAENCFNGVDDDCDGHVDCDDSDCTAVAVCVPDVTGSFAVGTTLDPVSLCPQSYSSLEVVMSGLTAAPNCSTGCTCGVTCFTQLYNFNSNCPDTDNENQFSLTDNVSCHTWPATSWNGTLDVHELATPASCQKGGAGVVPTSSWAAQKRFCAASVQGTGCAAGNICVPVTPGPKCEIAAGAQTCDPGYNAVSGPWYTGLTDTRSCNCSCGAPTGNCGTTVTLYSDTACAAGGTSFAATAQNNFFCTAGGSFRSSRIAAAPTCGAPVYNPESGALTPTGAQTLCCAP